MLYGLAYALSIVMIFFPVNMSVKLEYLVKLLLLTRLTHSRTMTPFDAPGKQAFWKHYGKRRNCSWWAISPFPTVFSPRLDNFLPFSLNLKLSSANSFSLEESKICCLVMGWNGHLIYLAKGLNIHEEISCKKGLYVSHYCIVPNRPSNTYRSIKTIWFYNQLYHAVESSFNMQKVTNTITFFTHIRLELQHKLTVPTFYDPEKEAFWKYCGKRRKCW